MGKLEETKYKILAILQKAGSYYRVEQGRTESQYIRVLKGDGWHYACTIRLSHHANPESKCDFGLGPYKGANASFADWHKVLPVLKEKAESKEEKEVFGHHYALECVKREKPNEGFEQTLANIRAKHKKGYNKSKGRHYSIPGPVPYLPIRPCDVAYAVKTFAESRFVLKSVYNGNNGFGIIITSGPLLIHVLIGDETELPEFYRHLPQDDNNLTDEARQDLRKIIRVGTKKGQHYPCVDWEALLMNLNGKLDKIVWRSPDWLLKFKKSLRDKWLARRKY